MGLFGGKKKICSFCGGKSGFLGSKLAGEDAYLCSSCRDKCTPGSLSFNSMTVEDVKENMAIAEENKRIGREEFRATREFYTGSCHDKPVIAVDEENGWFMNTHKDDGWVYNIDDISYYNMRISTSREEDKDLGFLDWLFSPDFYSNYPELPQVPYNEKLTGAYLNLRLLDNDLGVDQVEIDVFPGLFTDEDDVRGAYECCHEFYEFMQEWRENGRYVEDDEEEEEEEAAAPETDIVETLTKLKGLVDAGILTEEEFNAKKKQLLGL